MICLYRLAALHRPIVSPIEMGSNGTDAPVSYAPISGASSYDVPPAHAAQLIANGYTLVGLTGTTAQRPLPSDSEWASLVYRFGFAAGGVIRYYDSTLSAWIVWDDAGQTWRNMITLALA